MSRRFSLMIFGLALNAGFCFSAHAAIGSSISHAATPFGIAIPPTASPAERLAAEQAAFDQASDPVAKAKALAKLQPAVFAQARATLDSGDDVGSLSQLQHFRDETTATVASLETLSGHASDHPSGFKELQIALREAVRQMDNILVALPPDKHPWFSVVRSDLVDSQDKLIDMLFPKQQRKQKNFPPS